ncbi:MAG: hypothetical protein AB8B51_10410 [Sedimentitalea sp.]
MVVSFWQLGWAHFASEPAVLDWVTYARPAARAAVDDPALAHWQQCENTWFVGVDALGNDQAGRIGGSGPLAGRAVDFIGDQLGAIPAWHRGQVSVMYPGYPRPRDGESAAATRYRVNRDAAHVDGILAEGPARRRFVREPHAFVLGIGLTSASADASPLVVWDGSHLIMQGAFRAAFAGIASDQMGRVDVTEIYQRARRQVFETCTRRTLPVAPGEATLLHRFTLHGVAPWGPQATAAPDGRMIAYFRPELGGGIASWVGSR